MKDVLKNKKFDEYVLKKKIKTTKLVFFFSYW